MASIGDTTRPAFAYDQATDTWVPVGIGPHSHTASGVGAVATSSFAAKGDLLVGTGAGTLVAQSVGANGTVLTADSAEADGVKWAAAAGGANAVYLTKYSTNTNYVTNLNSTTLNTITPTLNVTYYIPLLLSSTTLDRIALRTQSTFSGTASVRLGIYNNDSTTNTPSTVLVDAGTTAPIAASTGYEITINQSVTSGLYWLAFNMQSAATTSTFIANDSTITGSPIGRAYTTLSAALGTLSPLIGYTESSVTGAFATAGTLTRFTSSPMPLMAVRY